MHTPIIGSGSTTGTLYYDVNKNSYRVDRENGRYDRYCGTVKKFKDTKCSHIVSNGDRYLYYPELNDCCYCCDSSNGCGILS